MTHNLRLEKIIDEIQGDVLADIGCDHGIVSIEALKRSKVNKVIACDISEKSLQKAKDLAMKEHVNNISFRCGDGLNIIKDNEIDCLVIAGMGGLEIIKILSNKKAGIKRYILLAHTHVEQVREFLVNMSLKIDKDYVLYVDRHYYNLIVATNGVDKLSDKELLLGRDDKSNPFYGQYLLYLKDKYEELIKKITTKDKLDVVKSKLQLVNKELYEG